MIILLMLLDFSQQINTLLCRLPRYAPDVANLLKGVEHFGLR
jgi:hypothetical protein